MTARRQQSNQSPVPRWLRRLAVIPVCAALMAAGSSLPGAPASAASRPRPAAVGPGVRPSPSAVPDSAVYTCAAVAWKAGFRFYPLISTNDGSQRPIVVAIAVGLAESSCNPAAQNHNGPTSGCPNGSTDRGLWQINDCYHSEVSNACAYQVQCNADAAWKISSEGTNWTPWSTYNGGAWKSYISDADSIINGGFTITLQNHGTNTCLDADSSQARNGGLIFQWACSSSDNYQRWTVSDVSGHNPIIKNVGTGTCLDADSSKAGNGQPIFQWACNSTADNYQEWWIEGSGQYNTNGQANAELQNQGMYYAGHNICLDADSSQARNGGLIFQWTCSSGDTHQQWN
jgi:hypothetical protein